MKGFMQVYCIDYLECGQAGDIAIFYACSRVELRSPPNESDDCILERQDKIDVEVYMDQPEATKPRARRMGASLVEKYVRFK